MAGPARRKASKDSGSREHDYATVFGSLSDYRKGHIDIIDDDPKNYVFSNVFEVAANAEPYERVVVGKNFEYVIETGRAEGVSPWFTNAHDEFVLCMDGEIEVHLVKPSDLLLPKDAKGGHLLEGAPDGWKMGRLVLRRGHQGLLPAGCAYRFHQGYSAKRSMLLVWENASLEIPKLIEQGKAPVTPVQF